MKILYSAGNRIGCNSQLMRILNHLLPTHTVRIAAYVKSSYSVPHIDWTLDSLHHNVLPHRKGNEITSLFGHSGVPMANLENTTVFLTEVMEFEPDVIICDAEPMAAHIAKSMGIKLWYCSPLHLLDGIKWERGQLRYLSKLNPVTQFLNRLPSPDKMFVYSAFGDIKFRPILKEGYEWMPPYFVQTSESLKHDYICVINDFNRFGALSKIVNSSQYDIALISPYDESFSNIKHYSIYDQHTYSGLLGGCQKLINTGETSYIADALYNNKNVCVTPSLDDPEALLSAILIKEYSLGSNVGQIEFLDRFALDELEGALSKKNNSQFISKQKRLYLHEYLV